ncbi:hypothetical protein BGZ63DRAFT_382052 [Mariannaea sp. PMI_226]|nr:hypothetical protein BGZ63DRAFT_382052 [Mariannaea sp. PMI_226]
MPTPLKSMSKPNTATMDHQSAITSHPSIASIPWTSSARLAEATEKAGDEVDNPRSNTRLYLAYGSNLSAETFLGMRGIRPISQVNVSVPELELKFNLPGVPYREPCFANVGFRKPPGKPPKLPDPSDPPRVPPIDPPFQPPPPSLTEWNQGLVGVVYEVTEEDYSTIIRTEGGGAGYKEIVVMCLPLPPRVSVPEKPPLPELPKPFMARTLYAPRIPDTDHPDDPRKKKWWYRFVVGPYRDPDYAQPSARYLKLIRDGAKEHEFPDEYQRWLQSLQPYTITSTRQEIGSLFFALFSGLMFLFTIVLSKVVDRDSKMPQWMVIATSVAFNVTWMVYDVIFKPLFGDGERTQVDDKQGRDGTRRSVLRHGYPAADEEKAALLDGFE